MMEVKNDENKEIVFRSMTDYVDFLEQNYAEQIAFRWIDDETQSIIEKSYIDFVTDIRRFSGFLRSRCSDTDGKHFALMAANSYHYAVAVYAIICVNAVVLPLNYREHDTALLTQLKDADVDFIISDDIVGELKHDMIAGCGISNMPITAFQQSQPTILHDGNDVDRLSVLMFTSGTSGKSKCVQLSLKGFFAVTEMVSDFIDDVRQTYGIKVNRYFYILPMFHIFGISHLLVFPYKGITLNMCLDFRHLARDLIQLDCNFTAAVPMLVENWMKALMRGKKEALGGIEGIVCGGATLDPSVVRIFADNGVRMIQAYGMTESFTIGAYNLMDNSEKYGSIGKPEKQTAVKFENGELCIQSDAVMIGYYKNDKETAEAIQEGWLHTGDMGYMDEDGYIFLTGRKKNLIILASGENVSPEELEGLVSANEIVKEVVVKEKNGKICAEIYCDEGKQDEIRSFITEVNRKLAMYKRMTLVEFRTEPFPRTASGKIKRV